MQQAERAQLKRKIAGRQGLPGPGAGRSKARGKTSRALQSALVRGIALFWPSLGILFLFFKLCPEGRAYTDFGQGTSSSWAGGDSQQPTTELSTIIRTRNSCF